MNSYQERDRILAAMGYESYADYLKSDLWKVIRQRQRNKSGRNCAACGRHKGWQTHHREYTEDNLSGVSRNGLVSLCRRCHESIELRSDGSKRTLSEANQELDLLVSYRLEREANAASKRPTSKPKKVRVPKSIAKKHKKARRAQDRKTKQFAYRSNRKNSATLTGEAKKQAIAAGLVNNPLRDFQLLT